MKNLKDFDVYIQSNKKMEDININNFTELIFNKIPDRSEDCDIIWSHDNEKFLTISLKRLRYVLSDLFKELKDRGIVPGDTVILADLHVNNILMIAIIFTALGAYGCRVMLPMWLEPKELKAWIETINCKAIIIPGEEINNFKKKHHEKLLIRKIKTLAIDTGISCLDIDKDFKIRKYVYSKIHNSSNNMGGIVKKIIDETNSNNEIVIFTTSGTSGRSKLVVYDQKAYINTISSYKSSGLYKPGKMLGRNFIDIFPHSISIRCLVNALWTGRPVCMITSDWVKNKPEKTLPLLSRMKPEVITIGPSSFGIVLHFIKMVPEIKNTIFSDLKTIVSTGAPYSKKIADEWEKQTGLILHNAYGLIETQQFTSTILSNTFNSSQPLLGNPFSGVKIGLKKFNKDYYKLFVKTIFGHKYLINITNGEKIYPKEFLDTGDIVKIDKKNNLYFIGRENIDYIKNGYGAKIPLQIMKEYYKRLYEKVEYIQYYPFEIKSLNLGIAALIFVNEKELPKGRVTHNHTINNYKRIIKKINKELIKKIEPFEYEHRAITRFLLINSSVPKTCKNTTSKYKIETFFNDEIHDLIKTDNKNCGVRNILRPRQIMQNIFMKLILMKNTFFRYVFD